MDKDIGFWKSMAGGESKRLTLPALKVKGTDSKSSKSGKGKKKV